MARGPRTVEPFAVTGRGVVGTDGMMQGIQHARKQRPPGRGGDRAAGDDL